LKLFFTSRTVWGVIAVGAAGLAGCGGGSGGTTSGSAGSTGGSAAGTAGISGSAGTGTSGVAGNSGSAGTGGTTGAGGSNATGSAGTGGTTGAGGTIGSAGTGGATGAGGNAGMTGTAGTSGTAGRGGTTGTAGRGGTTGAAGTTGTAGTTGSAGTTGTAGTTGIGGSTATGARSVSSFDAGWLFNKGDASGAEATGFADSAWRMVNVPHDWSIEGPFDQNATTLGNGGYLPAGIGWYRKHFTLPTSMMGKRIFVEFDGVMANADIYINGTKLGTRNNGYISFRYEITTQAVIGGSGNVIAVKANNTSQPASRWYAGAGIYRHVRLIATDPVHVAQWATFVTTPTVSTSSATVHVQTTVQNQGTAAASVTVQAVVTAPNGTALTPVTAAAQSVAAGASVAFSVDVPVSSPMLWSPTSPSLYTATVNVAAGGTVLDDDVVTFGIRTIKFDADAGFSLNGTATKLKGAGMHHDVSGLGAAVPMRAWQRRLAQMKQVGINAIRTSHNPYSPEFLDLADRMGFMVMDEFFDAWTGHKVSGDFGGTTFTSSGQADLTDTIKRDRNHPSVVLYSIGNEIRDSLSSQLATAMTLTNICHTTDSTRPVTQALFRPKDNMYYPGNFVNVLDVFGANYRISEVAEACALTPHHPGVVTEAGTSTSDWSMITGNDQLTGEFIWTAFDYLGEAADMWPTVGSSSGIMDRMGTHKSGADSYQRLWSSNPVSTPASGTTAAKLVVTADHTTMVTDPNDVVYVKAAVADSSNRTVTSASSTAITFSITGPGTIIAVDSGSVTQETFRGNVRNSYQGLAFAIVQATGAGTITVTAAASGLTSASATVQASAGAFVPCSGTCD
jgi:beta-galactosidase